jgi:hypothetical protein
MTMDHKLSPDDVVVIFGDLQYGIADLRLTVPTSELLRSAQALARLAEVFDMPTLMLTIPKRGGGSAVVLPDITGARTQYKQIQRSTCDSFLNAEIREAIEATGRKTLVVCGVLTEIVVQWLVLSGIANGYKVHVVIVACGGLAERSEQAALRRFEAAGAVLTSFVSLAGEVAGDFRQSPGSDVVEIIYQFMGL